MSQAIDLLLTPNMVLSVSGRRSGGGAYEGHSHDQIGLWIDRLRPDVVMSGMALGIDTVAADAAIERHRDLHAVIPGEWQPNRWSEDQRLAYRMRITLAKRLTVIDKDPLPGGAASRGKVLRAFHLRNRWMAAHSTLTLICWDGVASGGTYHMIGECLHLGQPVLLSQPGEPTRLLCDAAALSRAINRVVPAPAQREMAVA